MTAINFSLLSLYVVAVITMIAIPGPVAILVTGAGLGGGPKRALVTILGTNLASLVLIAASMLMVAGVLVVNESVLDGIKLLGALYIAYLGYEMMRETGKGPDLVPTGFSAQSGGFVKGFGMCISNPKDIIFFASFFPQFLTITPSPSLSISVLTVVWIILDFSVLMSVYLLANQLLRPGLHHIVLRLSGALLLVIGLASAAFSLLAHLRA